MDIIESIFFILQDGLELGLIWSIMALGIFISYRALETADLTAEGAVTLGSSITLSLILKGMSAPLALLIALLGGFIAGAITGILHTKLKIPAILSGIITMTGLYSINLRVMGKASLYLGDEITVYSYLREIINSSAASKIMTTLLVVVIIFFILYWFFGTEIGMSLRATGMNQKMARAQGINTHFMIILGLAISNALIALSGALSAQSNRTANMDIGKGTIVIGLASIIIGEVIFGKKSFKNWLIAVILGSIVFQIIVGIAIALGLNPNDLKLVQAILIAFILALPVIKKTKAKYKKPEVKLNA
ncbi:MAG: ABC transporter permease [Bacilli bacterium]